MKSLKDSLQAMATPVDTEIPEEKPILWIWIIVILISFFILFKIIKFGISFTKTIKAKQAVYRQSEVFYFKRLLKILSKKPTDVFVRELYIWFDKARKPEQSAAIKSYLTEAENILLENVISTSCVKSNNSLSLNEKQEIIIIIQNIRNKILNSNSLSGKKNTLNPV